MSPFVRRRPLVRAAAVGGTAYLAGRAGAKHGTAEAVREADQREQTTPQPEVPKQADPSMLDQLNQLTALHERGALTDAEFSAAKARLLNDAT